VTTADKVVCGVQPRYNAKTSAACITKAKSKGRVYVFSSPTLILDNRRISN
jgi:hypothetical protein